jgi:hypothetical protein
MGGPGIPPLAGSEWVVGSEKRLIAILLKGAQGPMNVKGQTYNGVMPPWEGSLTDKKIAAVASYVRNEWGNSAPEISAAKVAAARKIFADHAAPFTEAELLQIPDDATLLMQKVRAPRRPRPLPLRSAANPPAPATAGAAPAARRSAAPAAPASASAAPAPAAAGAVATQR